MIVAAAMTMMTVMIGTETATTETILKATNRIVREIIKAFSDFLVKPIFKINSVSYSLFKQLISSNNSSLNGCGGIMVIIIGCGPVEPSSILGRGQLFLSDSDVPNC